MGNNNYGLNVNMIGSSMYPLYLYLTKNIYTKINSKDKTNKKSIIDYFGFNCGLNLPLYNQIENVFKIYKENKSNLKVDLKEDLIVNIKNKISDIINLIFSKLENLKRANFMPLVLFLLDEYNINEIDNIIIPNKELYPYINASFLNIQQFIDKNHYLFESEKKLLTKEGENKMEKIMKILLRFCIYHNDLGDRFSLGEGDKIVNYYLTESYFPFTINI